MSGKQRKENKNANISIRPGLMKQQGLGNESMTVDNVRNLNESVDMLDDADVMDDEAGGTRIGDIYIPPPVPAHCSQESKGPRMIIKNIMNQNFKSYAGEVVLGPFHHCFTAIIGPNGSGKSNVIDSMLFVFGYRANKIRCKKLSTLIHNSSKYPNLQRCSVAVHFEQVVDIPNSEKCEIVPNSRIVVERTAHRDNSSYYTINGRRVQFKEVAKLLKEHNVDLDHNRFLILQGEVESIAMMKPKAQNENDSGMLEYLEDIVGTTRYIKPLQLINQRVEKLTEERTEKHNRCKLAEREMDDLEKPFNEAVRYLRLENEHTRTKNLRIQKYLCEIKKQFEEHKKEHERAVTVLKEHDDAADQFKKEREEKEKLIRKEMEEFEELRKNKENIEKRLEKTKSKHTEVVKTMDITNERRKNNKKQVTQNETKLENLQKVPEKNRKEIEECEKKIERLNKDKTKLEEELQENYTQLHEQTKPLIEKREKLETELLDIDINQPKGDLACLESQLKILKNDETTEARKYHSLKSAYEESQKTQIEKRASLEEITMKIPEINKEIVTKSNELKKFEQDEQNIQAQLNKIRGEIRERTVSIQNQRSNNQVLDLLMRLKGEGRIPGVLGRLGNLGGIDARYDVAISTACGRLDNIVVDTVDTAQQCIEMLKKHNAGRGTFIALEKVSHLAGQMHPINTPENVSRLFDLVHVEDERVRPAFYFSLRDTLVCDNLDQGSRIGYGKKRYRVVTLKGEIIEQSGTMSGGGGRPIRGKMGTRVQTKTSQSADNSISQKDLEDMQVQAEELQSKVNYCQEEQGRLDREIYQLKTQLQKCETEIKHLNITLKSLEQQLPSSYKQLEAQRKRMEQKSANPQKVQELEQKIEDAKKRVEEAEKEAGKVSKKIDEIKEQIESIHGDKVKSVQTKINGVANQIKKLTTNVSKLNVEITTSERDIVKVEKQTENLKAEIEKAQEELKALNEKHNELLEEQTKLEEAVEEAQKAIANAKSQSSDIQKEVHKLQKLESDNKLKRVEIEQKVQTVASNMNNLKVQIPHWQQELKPLKLNEIPGDTEPLQPLKTYTDEELATYTFDDIQYKESVQEEELQQKPNLSCINEFINKREVYLDRVKVLEDITSKRNEMRDKYEEVRKRRYTEFMDGFRVITRKLKEMYQMITQGGDAELELVDSMDPFTEGVSFSVRPPKKTWKNISNLSGGEKTLSSLALVFALHYYKPSPLYFMDEIDAALDFKNVSIVAHYIKERTKNAQFIIVSLRSNMFELSNYLVGIYKTSDCTNTICVKNKPPTMEALSKVTNNMQQLDQTFSQTLTQKTQQTLSATIVGDENDENVPPVSQEGIFGSMSPQRQNGDVNLMPPSQSQGRETTFAPPSESTALPQTLESSTAQPATQPEDNNPAILLSQGRETTFAPNLESTALSQMSQGDVQTSSSIIEHGAFKIPNPPTNDN